MRLMPTLVIEEDEVDLLLAALDAAIDDLLAGVGPEATARPRRRRPRREPGRPRLPARRDEEETMADWDELAEALADYTVNCNENARLRKMQRDWSRVLHFVCSDNGTLSRWKWIGGRS